MKKVKGGTTPLTFFGLMDMLIVVASMVLQLLALFLQREKIIEQRNAAVRGSVTFTHEMCAPVQQVPNVRLTQNPRQSVSARTQTRVFCTQHTTIDKSVTLPKIDYPLQLPKISTKIFFYLILQDTCYTLQNEIFQFVSTLPEHENETEPQSIWGLLLSPG